jgi:hypothetical protein
MLVGSCRDSKLGKQSKTRQNRVRGGVTIELFAAEKIFYVNCYG